MTMNVYAKRRAAVLNHMRAQGGGIAIIPTAPEVMRNADADYPYRHDSYFYYLTGFTEPEATLVLVAGEKDQTILFCREKNEEREIWDGYRFGPEAAASAFDMDEAYSIHELKDMMPSLLAGREQIFYPIGLYPDLDLDIKIGVVAGHFGETVRGLDFRMARRGGRVRTCRLTGGTGRRSRSLA